MREFPFCERIPGKVEILKFLGRKREDSPTRRKHSGNCCIGLSLNKTWVVHLPVSVVSLSKLGEFLVSSLYYNYVKSSIIDIFVEYINFNKV